MVEIDTVTMHTHHTMMRHGMIGCVFIMKSKSEIINAMHYPSKILGFLQEGEEINAIIPCAIEPLPWLRLEEEFIVKLRLNTDVGKEEIVPLSLLVPPIYVVPNFGVENKNEYMMILPKGQSWSGYFARFVNNGNNSL